MARLGRRQPNRPIVQHARAALGPLLGGPTADATGTAHQDRLFYAANGARWWLVWIDQTLTDTLHLSWSTDLVSWTDAGTINLRAQLVSNLSGTQSNNRWARNLGCAYKSIASTDVLYVFTAYGPIATDHQQWVQRITLGAGTFAVTNAEAQIGTTIATSNAFSAMGVAGAISTDNFAWAIGQYSTGGMGNMGAHRASNADTGSGWTAGFASTGTIGTAHSQFTKTQAILPVGASAMLGLVDHGLTAGMAETILDWSKGTSATASTWTAGGTPPDYAAVLTTTGSWDVEDWAACRVSDTDVHVVVRDPDNANAFLHKRWNGTTFGAGQSIPTQATKAGAGLFTASDGTDVWLFAVDSDAANTVRYVKWTAATPAWGTWTALEASTQVRTALTGYRLKGADSNFGVMWTEDAGAGAFRIVTKPLAISAGVNVNADTATTAPFTAADAVAGVAVNAGSATITVAAADAVTALGVNVDTATVPFTAADATVTTANATNAPADPATVTFAAADATAALSVNADTASTGMAAADATAALGANAAAAATTVTAADATAAVAVNAGAAAITMVAADATVSTATIVNVDAGSATITVIAADATAALGVNADTAAVPFTAADATVSTATLVNVDAGAASTSLTAADATAAVAVNAGAASITVAAADAVAQTGVTVNAGTATITITAADATPALGINATAAAVTFTAAAATADLFVAPPVPPPRWVEQSSAATGVHEGATSGSQQVELVGAASGIVEGGSSL
jgi:hypothetical protein